MKGFSLLETILYMGLLSLMFTGLITSTLFLHDSMVKNGQAASALLDLLNERDASDIGIHEF